MSTSFTAGFCARNPVKSARFAELTTMRVGGPATLVTLECREDLPELLDQPLRWLGKGANLLVGDDGVPETVARLGKTFAQLTIGPKLADHTTVTVGAGFDLAELISTCIKAGLAGPEGLAGVPASVGGALRMNAGTATGWMLDWVKRVEVVLPGERAARWVERSDIPAAYRTCGLPHGTLFLGCELHLASGDPEALRATAAQLKGRKAATQPLALPSAGCVFKNPAPTLPAGKLIDELGLKGNRRGGASISTLHGNFIVNDTRTATCADVVELITLIRRTAWQQRQVVLNLEIETWNVDPRVHVHPQDLEASC